MIKYFTGIGSRETPADVQERMESIASELCLRGWILRSGAAIGADSSFERGCDSVNGKKEIFLPWKNFNHSKSTLYPAKDLAYDIAMKVHPAWSKCGEAAKKLHARNCHQILGWNLDTPSDVVICYTEFGRIVGGTATAIRLAQQYNITVYNMGSKNDIESLERWLETLGI